MTTNQPDTRSVPETGAHRNSAPEPSTCTDYPNAIFDTWMPILSPSEFSVVMVLARIVFGHTGEERTPAVLAARTGRTLPTVRVALKRLKERGLINENYDLQLEVAE
jgi:hypothetical protein